MAISSEKYFIHFNLCHAEAHRSAFKKVEWKDHHNIAFYLLVEAWIQNKLLRYYLKVMKTYSEFKLVLNASFLMQAVLLGKHNKLEVATE